MITLTVSTDDNSGDDHHDKHDPEENLMRKFLRYQILCLQTQDRGGAGRLEVVSLAVVFLEVLIIPPSQALSVTEDAVSRDGGAQGNCQHGGESGRYEPDGVDDHPELADVLVEEAGQVSDAEHLGVLGGVDGNVIVLIVISSTNYQDQDGDDEC